MTTLDFAKAMIDERHYPMTVYLAGAAVAPELRS